VSAPVTHELSRLPHHYEDCHAMQQAINLAEELGVEIDKAHILKPFVTRQGCDCCSAVYTFDMDDGIKIVVHVSEDADVDEGRWRDNSAATRVEVSR
jgi:hypothetical protein